jgi:hypothetical protein
MLVSRGQAHVGVFAVLPEFDRLGYQRSRVLPVARRIEAGWGNSRQLCFVEKWFPGERFPVGLVKMSILQKLSDTSEVFTKE